MAYRTTPSTTPCTTHSRRLVVGIAVVAGLLLAACNTPPADAPDDVVRERLVGSWLRDYDQDGAQVRRLLVLEADGRFTETAKVVDASGAVTQHAHAGQWMFDGTNLKRRYTSFDGKQPSAPTLPYLTLQLRFESHREFVGLDNVRKREVHYQRVGAGTVL
jgi:hypothetical protein